MSGTGWGPNKFFAINVVEMINWLPIGSTTSVASFLIVQRYRLTFCSWAEGGSGGVGSHWTMTAEGNPENYLVDWFFFWFKWMNSGTVDLKRLDHYLLYLVTWIIFLWRNVEWEWRKWQFFKIRFLVGLRIILKSSDSLIFDSMSFTRA